MKNLIKEFKYIIFIFIGICVTLLTAIIPIYVIPYISVKIIIVILSYLTVTFLLKKIIKSNITKSLFSLPFAPFALFFKLLTFTIPISLILMNIFLYFGLPIVICFLFFSYLNYQNYPIGIDLQVYTTSLVWYISLVTTNKLLLFYLAKLSPARYSTSQKLKPYNIKEISEYILSEDNIKMLIFTLNFCVITAINLNQFQGIRFFEILYNLERPIIQSLVSFIAFDRVVTLMKTAKFKPSILYQKTKEGIDAKIKQLEQD